MFGRDLSCKDDLDPAMREVEGLELMREAAHRRLHTRRGQLLDDENYGIDVVDFLNAEQTPDELALVPSQIAAELRKDERIESVSATPTTKPGGVLEVLVIAQTTEGPFSLTLPISEAAAELMKGSG